MRRTRIILTLVVLALLVTACGGSAAPAAPSSSGSGASDRAAAAPAPKSSAGAVSSGATESKPADPGEWAKVKAWKGTISITNIEQGEAEIDTGEIRIVETVGRNNSATATVTFDEFVEVDDEQVSWMLEYDSAPPAQVSIDETIVRKTYNKGGELDHTETGVWGGSGEGFASFEASGLNIHTDLGTYDIGFNAGGAEIEWTTRLELAVGHVQESSGTDTDKSVGGGVSDIPLPSTVSKLTGSKQIEKPMEGTITWELEPIR